MLFVSKAHRGKQKLYMRFQNSQTARRGFVPAVPCLSTDRSVFVPFCIFLHIFQTKPQSFFFVLEMFRRWVVVPPSPALSPQSLSNMNTRGDGIIKVQSRCQHHFVTLCMVEQWDLESSERLLLGAKSKTFRKNKTKKQLGWNWTENLALSFFS